jgi:tripartite-type tricarboxylate transporter receptor subunit TctC
MERRLSKSMAGFVLSLGLIVLTVIPGHTQETKTLEFPNRPINFIVPWSPGTSADIAFRALGREAEKHFRQPVMVANKAGGGGSIGTAAIATAKPDGYTVGQCAGAQTLFVISFLEKVPYHPLKDCLCQAESKKTQFWNQCPQQHWKPPHGTDCQKRRGSICPHSL